MKEIIDFFSAPYTEATTFLITLEIVAVFFGIASVLYAKKENIWVFPTGVISTVLYIYICHQFTLYGDMVINLYYTLMSLYGWYVWNHKTSRHCFSRGKGNGPLDSSPQSVTFEGHVVKVGAPIIEISSSLIRSAIKAGKNVQPMLPKAVWVYLDEMNFYK